VLSVSELKVISAVGQQVFLSLSSEVSDQTTLIALCCVEQSKLDLMHEMEKRAANSDEVKALQSNIDGMAAELAHVSTKLQEAAIQLSKEKARNKAVSEHTSVSNHFVFSRLSSSVIVLIFTS